MVDLNEILNNQYTENKEDLCFDTIPLSKVIILTITTFGIYSLIWHYNYWKKLKNNFGYNVNPFWRAFFSSITCFFLFPILNKYIKAHNVEGFAPIIFAIILFFLPSTSGLPNPHCIISFLFFVPFTIIQTKINKVNSTYYSNAKENGWTGANIVWSVLLGTLALLSFVGCLLPQ